MSHTELVNKDQMITPFVIFNTQLTEIRQAMQANIGDSGVSAGDFEQIKLPAGGGTAWTVPGLDGEETVKEIGGIIVAWRDTRAYWRRSMEESDGSSPPDCASADARTGIGVPGGNCVQCQFAQFGSDSRGGQACKLVRQLFVVREGNMLPEIVNLPPTSVKPARQYLMRLASKGIPCYGVVTKIGLEKTKSTQGIVYSRATLRSEGRLPSDQVQKAKQYADMIVPFLQSVPSCSTSPSVPAEGEII